MIKVRFINFGYYADQEFSCIEVALAFAKSKGYEVAFEKDGRVIGSWSIIGGYRGRVA